MFPVKAAAPAAAGRHEQSGALENEAAAAPAAAVPGRERPLPPRQNGQRRPGG